MKPLVITCIFLSIWVALLLISAKVFTREQPLVRISPSGYTYAPDGSLVGVSCDPLATQPCPGKVD